MENVNYITVLFGSLISILLSVVAYFIKQLHTDFKRMEKDLVEVKTMALIIKTEFKSGNDLLNQKVEYLEKRVQTLEISIFKNQEYEK
jgi:chaperonin cofactor prefoldin